MSLKFVVSARAASFACTDPAMLIMGDIEQHGIPGK